MSYWKTRSFTSSQSVTCRPASSISHTAAQLSIAFTKGHRSCCSTPKPCSSQAGSLPHRKNPVFQVELCTLPKDPLPSKGSALPRMKPTRRAILPDELLTCCVALPSNLQRNHPAPSQLSLIIKPRHFIRIRWVGKRRSLPGQARLQSRPITRPLPLIRVQIEMCI